MLQQVIKSLGGWRLLVLLALGAPVAMAADATMLSNGAIAQGVIRQIAVEGNRRVEPETVRSYLRFSVGDAYDDGAADASLRALFGTGLFSDVQIYREGSTVIIAVVENPVINQVAFEGNYEVDTDTLRGEVRLGPRSVFTRARVQADVQRILDVYRRQGRFAASVDPKLIELEQNRVNLVFEITEGGATKVKGINFVGNQVFSDTQLRDIITTTESGWFDFLKGTAVYDPDRLNLDRELIRQYYLKNGYADARVVAANAELDVDSTGFFVNFTIDEGARYTFGAVDIQSTLPGVQPESLYGQLLTAPGDTYNGADIDKTVERLTLSVAEQGYAFVRVRPRALPDPVNRTISVIYNVEDGPRIYIERINIAGNGRTKDHVIRREFRLAEGDAYNPLLVDRAKKRLEGLGIFEKVAVNRSPGSARDRVIIDVDITEKSTGELSFGAGFSTAEGVIGDVSITERNLLGNGQFLRLGVSGSLERLQVDLSFTEPRFLDRNLSAGFDLFHKEIDQTEQSGFSTRKSGGQLRLGFPLAQDLWMTTSYGFDRNDIYDDNCGSANRNDPVNRGTSKVICQEIQEQGSETYTSAFTLGVTYDKRNHPRDPTEGFYLAASSTFAGLGGDVQYARMNAEARAYYPVTEKITLIGRAIGGHIEGWGGDNIRVNDLFFRGGETIRGFDRAGVGPRDLQTGDAIGGQSFWAVTAEMRFPLPFIPEDLGLSGAIFADAGSVFGANDIATRLDQSGAVRLADDSTIRSSVGASIMWKSPMGPLRMDFAHALSKEDYDDEQFFRFGASSRF
jgi:outer membrane protein insertion porin family